jgi:GT2 family glycosyltransferase
MTDVNIAVVIVTYKSAALTIKCLDSLRAELASPGLRIRVFVVDNASGDFAAIASHVEEERLSDWVALILAPKNGGFAYGNNLGISAAYARETPDFVYLLNPDTEVRPGAIGALVRFLQLHAEVGIAGSAIENPDGSDWPIAFRFPGLLSEFSAGLEWRFVSRFLRRWEVAQNMSNMPQAIDWICGASMMIRPTLLAAIGGLDENYFLYFEETDFCFRARQAGFATWYVPESRIMHIVGQSTKVTERVDRPRRLPAYWFESRRRYFAVNLGVGRAMAVDIVALFAHSVGLLKRIALGRLSGATPFFIRDLLRHSVLRRRNRQFPQARGLGPSLSSRA